MSHDAVDTQSLYVRDGADYRRATAQELMKALNRFISNRVRKGSSMESPHAVRAYLRMQLSQLEYEMFCMLALDLCVAHIYVQQQRRIAASPDS